MDNTSRVRSRRNDRARLAERGLARFEVIGRAGDRALIRSLARQLADGGPEAARLRQSIDAPSPDGASVDKPSRKGGIYAALRRSPLVGADLDLTRLRVTERDIDL